MTVVLYRFKTIFLLIDKEENLRQRDASDHFRQF